MILGLVSEILGRVGRLPGVEGCLEALRRPLTNVGRRAGLAGLTDTAKAVVAAAAAQALGRPAILLVESNQRADQLIEPMRWFYAALKAGSSAARSTGAGGAPEAVALLPAHDVFPYENRSPHPEISEDRAVALWRFASGAADLLIAPVQAAIWRLRDAESYRQLALALGRDQEIGYEDLVAFLAGAGYEKQPTCEMPGQYAVRGGIIDVFSPESVRPVRIELLGDTIESLRAFDPDSQRSINPIERTTLLPLTEFVAPAETPARVRATAADSGGAGGDNRFDELADERLQGGPGWEFRRMLSDERSRTLFDLAASGEVLVMEDEPELLEIAIEKYRQELGESLDTSENPNAEPPARYVLEDEEWALALEMVPRLALEQLAIETGAGAASGGAGPSATRFAVSTQPTTKAHGNVQAFMAEARARLAAGEAVMVSAASTGEMERLADLCHEYELPYRIGELEENTTVARLAEEGSTASAAALLLVKAPLSEGVAIPDAQLVIHGNADLFETLPASQRQRARPKTASFFSDFSDLKPGDYIVHLDHGIGQFEGLRQVTVEGAAGEFMLLRYAAEAKLYVPLARLDLIQKYQSLGGAAPQLDRLGANLWEQRKTRVRKSVNDMADQLLELYAGRKMAAGHAFAADSAFQREFEDAFEFQETPDQERAVADVKRDMESPLPMDRLLCGDVGYGKTEVAMRAAFKAIADSKQVAVLAPTTVLAFQHFQTFRQRFAAFPARVEMLSRFRSAREQKKTLEELEAGKIDVVVGTHRLLSKDIKFQDLGLLVVDEEQRFGVAAKERLKEMRKDVDVLTMSATPIPRTLHMSLVGLRDMSVIETPPKDRLAIQTTVAPFSEGLVQRAIQEELARGGQVFFVHNRVETIGAMATMLRRLVPKARVLVGHGQMKESELEKVMLNFVRDEGDVLLSTTIIENGLDIPRANTILINHAERFGLAELYQLRGRVGRSNQRAYAYLLIPPDTSLSGIARQRLAALKEFSDLGAGFRIAALDLELRGAGNLLGREQHGHIEAVGFDLYCQMLERAVAERKGESATAPVERRAALNLGLDIRIPPDYIDAENLRLRIYKRISAITSDAMRDEVRKELSDRFGPPPPAVENLLEYAVLKAMAEKALIASVDRRGHQAAIKFHEETPVGPERLVKMIRKHSREMRLDPSGVLWLDWRGYQGGVLAALRNVLLQLQA